MTTPDQSGVIVADLGGTLLRVAVFDAGGEIRYRASSSTPSERPAALVDALLEAASAVDLTLRGAVVGVPGPVDYFHGEVHWLPNLSAWQGQLSAARIADMLSLPVLLANDADLGALGEHRSGAGRGVDDMVYVTVGTGVGAGVIINGQLLHGRWSLAEIGHMIIDRATGVSVEDLCSGSALRRIAGRDPRQTVEAARNDHPAAVRQVAQISDALAVAILNLLYCYMPDRAVIGGGMAEAGALFLDPIRAHITEAGVGLSLSADDIVLAEHGSDVGLLGGYALGTDAFFSGIGSHGIVITTPSASPA